MVNPKNSLFSVSLKSLKLVVDFIPHSIRLSIKNKLTENIKNKYNITYDEFVSNKLRYIKGSTKLKNIDSVYRNRMK